MLRLKRRITLDILEPFGRVARGVLDFQHFDAAFSLVALERARQINLDIEGARQRDRVLERELGPRPDREMRGMRCVAHQHDGHVTVPMDP